MSKTTEWAEIMNLFKGLRFEVHTDLAEGRALVLTALRVQEALGWLVFHRLVWHDGVQYVARMPREAAALWAEEGADKLEAANVARAVAAKPAGQEPEQAPGEPAAHAVHPARPHQTSLFA